MPRRLAAPLDTLERLKQMQNALLLKNQKILRALQQENRKLEMRAKHLLGDWILEVHPDVLAQCVEAYQQRGRQEDAKVLVLWHESAHARKQTSSSGGKGSGKTDAAGSKSVDSGAVSPTQSRIHVWRNRAKANDDQK